MPWVLMGNWWGQRYHKNCKGSWAALLGSPSVQPAFMLRSPASPLPPLPACPPSSLLAPTPCTSNPTPFPCKQQRCMYNIKGAFKDMQRDLAPLAQGKAAAAAAGEWQLAACAAGARHGHVRHAQLPPCTFPIIPLPHPVHAGGEHEQQSVLERELAAGREVARALTAADREQQQRVEANVRHVLRQVSVQDRQKKVRGS